MSNYYLLIAVIIVLAAGAVKGYRKGFLRLAVFFAGLIAVLFIVTKISPYISRFLIENTTLYGNLREKIVTAYENRDSEVNSGENPGNGKENDTIDSFGFPDLISNSLKTNNTSEIYQKLAVSLFRDYISGYSLGLGPNV